MVSGPARLTGREGRPSLRAHAVVLVLAACANLAFLWPAIAALQREGRDLRQDYIGAARLLAGQDVYGLFSAEEYAALGVDPGLGVGENAHPPTTLALFAPLAGLSFQWAVAVWSLASLLFFLITLHLIARELDLYGPLWALSFVAWLWFPFWLHIRFGQFSTLMALLLTLAWIGVRRRRWAWAGGWLAAAGLIKLFPLYIALWPFAKRRWSMVLAAGGVTLAGWLVCALWRPRPTLEYLLLAAGRDAGRFRGYYGNSGLAGFLGRILVGYREVGPVIVAPAVHIPLFIVLACLTAAAMLAAVRRMDDMDLEFSLFLVGSLFLSPVTWVHNWTMLVLPWAILYTRLPSQRRWWLAAIVLVSGFPHWQFLNWLEARYGSLPLPGMWTFTSPGFYVLVGTGLLLIVVWRSGARLGGVLERAAGRAGVRAAADAVGSHRLWPEQPE
jgi:hypothetical protein